MTLREERRDELEREYDTRLTPLCPTALDYAFVAERGVFELPERTE